MPEPIRVELDYPVVVVTNFGHIIIGEDRNFEATLASLFPVGSVATLHVVIETTGEVRPLCKWINPDTTDKYRSKCSYVVNENGVCPQEFQHSEKERLYRESLPEKDSQLTLGSDTDSVRI